MHHVRLFFCPQPLATHHFLCGVSACPTTGVTDLCFVAGISQAHPRLCVREAVLCGGVQPRSFPLVLGIHPYLRGASWVRLEKAALLSIAPPFALCLPGEAATMTDLSPIKCEMGALFSQAGDNDFSVFEQPFWPSSHSSLPAFVPFFDMHRGGTARGRTWNSANIDSIRRSEGCRVGQDTGRYMVAAAASTNKTVHQLLSRLQTYRTFKPFLSPPAAYRGSDFGHDSGVKSASRLSLGRTSTATVSRSQLWQMVDGILDTSVAQLLQHGAEGHFIMTLQSTLGLEAPTSTAKGGTVIESRKAATPAITGATAELASGERTPAGGARQPLLPGLQKAGATSSFALPNALADRWALDHPSASAAAVEEQRRAWTVLGDQRQRTNRSLYLQAMQAQLDILQAEQAGDGADTTDLPPSHRGASRGHLRDMRISSDSEDSVAKVEEERQQALWHAFHDGPVLAMGTSQLPDELTKDGAGIVTAYLENADLQEWLHSSWPHRTHRHESAALRIQCAYRVYQSRCKVREMRYERRQAFLASLSAERKARGVWDLALQVQKDTTTTDSGTDSTLRALQFFINKVNAVVVAHRARKEYRQQQDAEIRSYAATRIQAVYRGHLTRVFATELRHPEIVAVREQLQRQRCATLIQTFWRRHTAQSRWRRMRHAACVLQNTYRCHAARRMLEERRYQRNLEASVGLMKFAAQRIERWYTSFLAARDAIGRAHMTELLILQRVCRGYQSRHRAQEEKRLVRLRSAVRTIEQHRRRVMDMREAIERRATLSASSKAKRSAAIRDDAAITIQRAWRRHHVLRVC
ncbi:hypothetical protein, conserved [Leishmania tarentolae]|uniref:Uncharacterized protein n=1 Tax=Leishmania tarentolae TaxID=5689 RepID=A0A640KIW4_LEITA|nr:hypothetical protein, conserved [Leishmania tarentolae]